MSTSQITVLKLRQLKQCDATSRVVSRLPVGCTTGALQFNVSMPTKLWKVIVGRQAMSVDGGCRSANVTLLPVRDIRDLRVSADSLSMLSRNINLGLCVSDAVLVKPVSEEEFSSYGLTTSYLSVSFDGPDNFGIRIVIEGLTGSGVGRAVFAVGLFTDVMTERPSGALVSCTINV